MMVTESVSRFRKNEFGASMVEYGVALLVVAALGVAAMIILGGAVNPIVTQACAVHGVAC